jgi:methionyl-tRNA synthetase
VFEPPCDPAPPDGFHSALERFEFDDALGLLWGRLRAINRDIERKAPWSLIEKGTNAGARGHLATWLAELHGVAHWLGPFLPRASTKIQTILTEGEVRRSEALFPRI